MIITMEKRTSLKNISDVIQTLEGQGADINISSSQDQTTIGVVKGESRLDLVGLNQCTGVEKVTPCTTSYRRVSREYHPNDTHVRVGEAVFGAGGFDVIAGPCAVESEGQIHQAAQAVAQAGATALRAGAFKPRSSPYSFQGHGIEGIRLLASAAKEANLACVSEVISLRHIDAMAESIDMLQVGTRNMHNFDLLKELGQVNKPILLKRGLSATIEEFLLAAEYIYNAGNPNIILCERGIRTYEPMTRNTLDIAAIPLVKTLSHLPIIVDPSHATGRRELVGPLTLASLAAGADGAIIEVHPSPEEALSDGPQSLRLQEFSNVMSEVQGYRNTGTDRQHTKNERHY